MNKEKKIDKIKRDMCGDYAPYCGCGCRTKHCEIENFAKNLIEAGYGNIAETIKDFAEKLKKIIHEDDFEQLCFDCAASEADVFNYIDNTVKEFIKEQ